MADIDEEKRSVAEGLREEAMPEAHLNNDNLPVDNSAEGSIGVKAGDLQNTFSDGVVLTGEDDKIIESKVQESIQPCANVDDSDTTEVEPNREKSEEFDLFKELESYKSQVDENFAENSDSKDQPESVDWSEKADELLQQFPSDNPSTTEDNMSVDAQVLDADVNLNGSHATSDALLDATKDDPLPSEDGSKVPTELEASADALLDSARDSPISSVSGEVHADALLDTEVAAQQEECQETSACDRIVDDLAEASDILDAEDKRERTPPEMEMPSIEDAQAACDDAALDSEMSFNQDLAENEGGVGNLQSSEENQQDECSDPVPEISQDKANQDDVSTDKNNQSEVEPDEEEPMEVMDEVNAGIPEGTSILDENVIHVGETDDTNMDIDSENKSPEKCNTQKEVMNIEDAETITEQMSGDTVEKSSEKSANDSEMVDATDEPKESSSDSGDRPVVNEDEEADAATTEQETLNSKNGEEANSDVCSAEKVNTGVNISEKTDESSNYPTVIDLDENEEDTAGGDTTDEVVRNVEKSKNSPDVSESSEVQPGEQSQKNSEESVAPLVEEPAKVDQSSADQEVVNLDDDDDEENKDNNDKKDGAVILNTKNNNKKSTSGDFVVNLDDEPDVEDEKSSAKETEAKATSKSKSESSKESKSKTQKCIVCEKVGKCKYNIVRNGDIKHLCDDKCFKVFRSHPTCYLKGKNDKTANGGKPDSETTCSQCHKPIESVKSDLVITSENDGAKHFCKEACRTEYKKANMCAYCYCDMSHVDKVQAQGPAASVHDVCSKACQTKYEEEHKTNPSNDEKGAEDGDVEIVGTSNVPKVGTKTRRQSMMSCAVCGSMANVKHEIEFNNTVNKLCSDACFSAFRYANKLAITTCDNCKKPCTETNSTTIQFMGNLKRFCTTVCLNSFKTKNQKILACQWCQAKKSNFDMVERVDTNNKTQLFCSLNCLSLYRVNLQATSNQNVTCDHCKKFAPAQYHLTMSDASVRNFCAYSCVMAFQAQFQQPQASGKNQTPPPPTQNKRTRPQRQTRGRCKHMLHRNRCIVS